MRIVCKLLALCLLLAGCPRRATDAPSAPDAALAPRVSPVGNQPYSATGAKGWVVRVAGADARAAVGVALPADARAPMADLRRDGTSDAELAAQARAAAQAKLDQAVDQVIARSAEPLRACFDRGPAGADRSATLRLRVRAGYVTTAEISGPSDAVRLCLEQALRGVKFEGPAAEASTVERKLEFKR